MAARAGASGNGGTWADVAKARAPGGAAAPHSAGSGAPAAAAAGGQTASSDVDDDGFQVVAGRRGRRGGATTAEAGEAKRDGGPTHDSDAQHADGDAGDAGGVGQGDDAGADSQPTTAALHQSWQDEVALVKRLRGQGLPDSHPAMRAACAARDAAENAWRGSKEPAPASIRLGRAQQKLDRAITLQADARQAITEAEAAHREKMSTLQATMRECADRVRLRRQQLRAVQEEVGAGATTTSGGTRQARVQLDAIRQVHGTICGEVGPALAALVEQVGTDTPAWSTLNGLLGKLAISKAALEGAAAQPADQFDIGDGGVDDGDDDAMGDEGTDWSESHELRAQAGGAGDPGDEQGAWYGWGDGRHDGADVDQPMDTEDWWGAPARRWGSARWQANGHGQWSKASWADQLEDEQGAVDDDDGQPPTARRRLDAAGSDQAAKEAQHQGQQQSQQPAQQRGEATGSGGEPAGADQDELRRQHNARVGRIVEMAVAAGVTPLTKGGEDLIMLGPSQLDAWIAECLPSALLC